VNDVFDILDHSKKSMDHVLRANRIAKEVKMEFDNFYLVGGYRFPAELGIHAQTQLNFKYLGKIVADEQLDEFVLEGESLLGLPSGNTAFLSVKEIMKTAGYL
jgi:CO dehydrogenase nickel-insertion accessory protein CooC1